MPQLFWEILLIVVLLGGMCFLFGWGERIVKFFIGIAVLAGLVILCGWLFGIGLKLAGG